jgi:hypothetical protein
MVIGVAIHHKFPVYIKCVVKLNNIRHEARPVYCSQMRAAYNGVYVNHHETKSAISLIHRLYHPKPCIIVFTHAFEPVNECAWIESVFKPEQEEQENTTDIHPRHSRRGGIRLNKDRVLARILTPPQWRRADSLTVHTACTA